MDSLTHIVLGACIGDAMLGNKLGKKAMLLGAIAQSFPDIDFTASLFMNTTDNLLAHRGFTHSFLCCGLLMVIFAMLARRSYPGKNISFSQWQFFFSVELFIHIFIDAFNNYGVGWFEPFSHYRISFNALYVIDPFFSIAPAVAALALLLRRPQAGRTFLAHAGIAMAFFYLMYCTLNKLRIDIDTREILHKQHISYNRYFTTPAPLNNWLWYVVAESDSGYYTGYRSVFDRQKLIDFEYFPRNEQLAGTAGQQALQKLIRFSQQYYTLETWHDTLVFNDLRFGQVTGWDQPRQKFAFHYYLNYPGNKLVVQRGRFAGWDRQSTTALLRRIRGN